MKTDEPLVFAVGDQCRYDATSYPDEIREVLAVFTCNEIAWAAITPRRTLAPLLVRMDALRAPKKPKGAGLVGRT